MLVTLAPDPATIAAIDRRLAEFAQGHGLKVVAVQRNTSPLRYLPGAREADVNAALRGLAGVQRFDAVKAAYGLVSLELGLAPSVVQVGSAAIGGRDIVLMAGPCAVESRDQLMACARAARAAGATLLRGGAYKPRTSPHAFTGHKEVALRWLRECADAYGLAVVTEVVDPADVPLVAQYADMLQVGARNMQNFSLLAAVGRASRPVLLKRGLSATYEEWLLAAEHVRVAGTDQIVLCERGIRTFERATRNTLDLAAVPVVRTMTALPIVIDPSHATGRRDAVVPMACAAVAAGADGLLIEAHPFPERALSDGPQSLTLAGLQALSYPLAAVAAAVGRRFVIPSS